MKNARLNATPNGRTRIKFCGITNAQDALTACQLGVDAIGFVFYPPSAVCISPPVAAAITQQLPPFVSTVALCVNHSRDAVKQIIDTVRPTLLQFHGDEPPDYCEQFNHPYIRAIRVQQPTDITNAMQNYPNARAILLDSYKKNQYGGTGDIFDWNLIPQPLPATKPIILAGGLKADNVYTAIRTVQPWGVDVSSHIAEINKKDRKNKRKMTDFIQEVNRANTI